MYSHTNIQQPPFAMKQHFNRMAELGVFVGQKGIFAGTAARSGSKISQGLHSLHTVTYLLLTRM